MMESFGFNNPTNCNYGVLATQFKYGVFEYLENKDNLNQIKHSLKTNKWVESMLLERERQKISSNLSRSLVIYCDDLTTSFITSFPIDLHKNERDKVVIIFFLLSLIGFTYFYLNGGFYYA